MFPSFGMFFLLLNTFLNFVTCGGWGTLKWIGRRLWGNGDRPTFFGRVAVFVAGHFTISTLTGAISPWGLLKIFGRSVMFVCAIILNGGGGKGELPQAEDAQVKSHIAMLKESADDKMDKMKAAMEERRQKIEADLERKRREIEERDLAGQIARRKQQAEDEIASKRRELEAKEQELVSKAKDAASEAGIVTVEKYLFGGRIKDNFHNNMTAIRDFFSEP